ncbi:MAG: lyase family protein [Pseudomonadota bacterium]
MASAFDHPWLGGLFGDEAIDAILSPERELARMLKVEVAWTIARGQVEGAADAAGVAKIIAGADLASNDLREGMARHGVPVPTLVKKLKALVADADQSLVHTGLTSQDVVDTALVLALAEVTSLLEQRLGTLDKALSDLYSKVHGRPFTAFTRMQPALPTTAETHVARWQQPMPTLSDDLLRCRNDLAVIQWGGPIGNRDHPKAEALGRAFAEELGLRDPGVAWHTDRSRLQTLGAVLARITTACGKIGQDIAVLAATGDQISLAAGGGSSAMAHKQNPIAAEALITLSHYASLLLPALHNPHENARSGAFWALEWITLPDLCVAAGASLRLAERAVSEINDLGRKA